jgi:Protein of unknown function with HXXEE motif
MTRPAADADTFRSLGDARRRRRRAAVVLTFPIAFALHDLEELLTAAAWGRRAPGVIRRRWPHAPDRVAELAAVTGPQMAVAIGVVASGVAAATRSGWRHVDGDLGVLPAAVAAYTGHGATHLLQSALLRGYTPGVATVPLVIAPYSWWAWRTLRRAGLPRSPAARRREALLGSVLAVALVAMGQAAGRARVLRPRVRRTA